MRQHLALNIPRTGYPCRPTRGRRWFGAVRGCRCDTPPALALQRAQPFPMPMPMPMPRPRRRARSACLLAFAALPVLAGACGSNVPFDAAPLRLADTGLFADAAARTISKDALPFEPQYPLWTDGAQKSRWITLPRGTSIDASDADHWVFPAGTRLWKQFTFAAGERPEGASKAAVETRFMMLRADGTWLYATYVRTPAGDDVLAPPDGVRDYCATADGKHHDVPGHGDCRLCHEGTRMPVLGFSALQLSPDRDPLAPNAAAPRAGAVDLPALVARGLLRNLDRAHLQSPPRIAARTPAERAALGYLHGNCSNCHNGDGPLHRLGLRFDHPLAATAPPALASTVGVAGSFTRGAATQRVVPGAPACSTLFLRVSAMDPLTQMPPFGRHLVDRNAVALLEQWIRTDLPAATATSEVDQPICKKDK